LDTVFNRSTSVVKICGEEVKNRLNFFDVTKHILEHSQVNMEWLGMEDSKWE